MAALAGITKVIGGMAATNAARKGGQAAQNAATQGYNLYNDIDIPDIPIEDQKLILEKLSSQGQLTPEMMQALNLSPSAMESVNADSNTIATQRDALNNLQDISKTGLTQSDQAAARQIQNQTAASDMSRRKAILDSMAQRGVLGSGAELAAQLDNVQKSQQSQADANDKLLQEAQARQLQALSQTGQLSGQMRGQEFNEGSARADARDAINKFNTQNQQQVNNSNVTNQNNAMKYNLDNSQKIADTNVDTNNAQQKYNKELLLKNAQQKFNNQMQRTSGMTGQLQQIGAAADKRAQATAKGISSTTDMFGNLFGVAGQPEE